MVTGFVAALGNRLLRSRPLVRAPLLLYRAGLGVLLGHRMLLLEHTGRTTGLTREAVLEVIGRPDPEHVIVVSGFGERAQWLRNVRADPRVRVSIARLRSVPATARVLDPADAARALAAYTRANRRTWAWFRPVLERTLGRSVDAETAPPTMVEFALSRAG